MKTMRLLFSAFLTCGLALLNAQSKDNNCTMAVTYSEMAFKDFKSAYKSEDSENIRDTMSKAIKNADEAAAFANICNCPLAKNYALNAVTFGNKAINEVDTKKQKKLIKQAMDMSLDVMTATPNCK